MYILDKFNWFQTFASCCSVLRSVWSTTASPQSVSWWARALAGRVISRAAAARRPTDMEHTRAAIAALTALDELVSAGPEHARECLINSHFIVLHNLVGLWGSSPGSIFESLCLLETVKDGVCELHNWRAGRPGHKVEMYKKFEGVCYATSSGWSLDIITSLYQSLFELNDIYELHIWRGLFHCSLIHVFFTCCPHRQRLQT